MTDYQPFYAKSYALVIGINSYADPRFVPLGNAEADAELFARRLGQAPFDFDVQLLLGAQATKADILEALFRLRETEADDRILVYFAGHGYTLSNRWGGETGYLACVDTLPEKDFTALELDTVTGLRDHASAKHIGFIFDACFSGSALGLTRGISVAADKLLERRAFQVISAGAADQTVADYRSMTQILLEEIESSVNMGGLLTLNSLGLSVQQVITADSRSRQIPQFGHLTRSQGGDLVLSMRLPEVQPVELETQERQSRAKQIRAAIQRLEADTSETATDKLTIISPDNASQLVESLRLHVGEGAAYGVAFSPDDSLLAAGSYQDTVLLWRLNDQAEVTPLQGHEAFVISVDFSPDGQWLASASGDGSVRLWNLDTLESNVLLSPGGHVYAARFSPSGQVLASAATDGLIHLWDPITLQEINTLSGHHGAAFSVAFSPDGSQLASSAADKTIRLWDMTTFQEIARLTGHTGSVWSIGFHPDGHHLVSGSADRSVRLWDLQNRSEVACLTGHQATIRGVCFSPDGKLIASASFDQTVHLWSVESQSELRVLKGPQDKAEGVAFSHDGTRLAATSHDRTIRVWAIH